MADQSLIEALKQVSTEAVKASNPTSIIYGNVISDEPVEIQIDSKLILDEDFLVFTKNVSKYKVDMKIEDLDFEGKAIIDNSLETGDKVIMIQIQGGQKYVVLDKLEQEEGEEGEE